jgi:biopolymer transport protein ExbB/TolQ
MRQVLVDVSVPKQTTPSSPWADTASVTPMGLSIALIAAAIALAIAIIVGLAMLGRAWSRTKAARTHPA